MKQTSKIIFVLFMQGIIIYGQDFRFPLYTGPIPNSKQVNIPEKIEKGDYTKITNVSNPDISVYLPTRQSATGQAVIICPGGGYVQLSIDMERTDIAGYLNSIGVHWIQSKEKGFGLALKDEHVASWTNSLKLWLRDLDDGKN